MKKTKKTALKTTKEKTTANKIKPGAKTNLSAAKLKGFHNLLLRIKDYLDVDKNQLEEKSLRGSGRDATGNLSNFPIHLADAGSDTYEQDFSLEILEREDIESKDIEDALERIDNKIFGICEECSKPINENRLKVIPYARFCVKCQEVMEKH
jgi:DnaK suppressor protein